MARRYGRQNAYKSRIRRCAVSGLRAYESDMVNVRGKWCIPEWADKPNRGKNGQTLRNR